MPATPLSIPEQAARIVRDTQREFAHRVADALKAGGWPGFQAHVSVAKEIDYYAGQVFSGPGGTLNPQAWATIVGRIGKEQAKELVKAMQRDWQRMQAQAQEDTTHDESATALQPERAEPRYGNAASESTPAGFSGG